MIASVLMCCHHSGITWHQAAELCAKDCRSISQDRGIVVFIEMAWHMPAMMTSVSNSLPLGGVISRMRTSPRLNQTDKTARCVEGDPCDGECHLETSSILSGYGFLREI